ncbi:MAG TPA: hypothetical protein VM529_26415 [Gemmata sp.]|nr:hypothetical protein [Gemmata sp.]
MIRLVRAKFRSPAAAPRKAPLERPRSRRRSARDAVWSGAAAFAALTAGLAAAIDTTKPEWRDPEFALRLRQVRRWQTERPDRPVVAAFGSSRTQMGLSPADMGFPDEPGAPLVFNFGYRAGRPLGAWLHFTRMMDAGVRPAAVLIQLAPAELAVSRPAEEQYSSWAPRFSPGDVRRLTPLTRDPAVFPLMWAAARLNPWSTYRVAVLSDLLPEWQSPRQRLELEWERMDEYGFSPHPSSVIPADVRLATEKVMRAKHARSLNAFVPADMARSLHGDVVARCRAEGVAVAFFWAPTSPKYRSWYSPASLAAVEEYGRWLAAEHQVVVFPAAEHLEETDFADGFHLLRGGAGKYSRWLADKHLQPWLASIGLAK